MKVVIIEDEDLNAELMMAHIKKFDDNITISTHIKSKAEAEEWFSANGQADLVFSDIELLDGNVFSFLQKNSIQSPIIFTTAYDTYYQDAFDVNGIAYLLKPISYNRFETAMHKFLNLKGKEDNTDWKKIADSLLKPAKSFKERVIIKSNNEITILRTDTIAAFLSDSGKCIAIDEKGKEHYFRDKISDLTEELNPNIFFQVNRGEIVNINYIEKIEAFFNDRLALKIKNYNGKIITSASLTSDFRNWIDR